MVRALQAEPNPPSRHWLMHLCCLVASCAFSEVRFCRGGLNWGRSTHNSARSPSSQRWRRERVQARRWFLCALPPLGKGQSTHLGSICNCIQASVVLSQAVVAVGRLRQRAHNGRSRCGTCLSVGTYRVWTSSRLGRGGRCEGELGEAVLVVGSWVRSEAAARLAAAAGRHVGHML